MRIKGCEQHFWQMFNTLITKAMAMLPCGMRAVLRFTVLADEIFTGNHKGVWDHAESQQCFKVGWTLGAF